MTDNQIVIDHFIGRLPTGLILNLGAGSTAHSTVRRLAVGVDLARPPSAIPPFVVADAHHLPFRDGSFDGAMLKDILEHVAQPIGVLLEASRVCKPQASLILTTPRAIARAVWDDPTHLRGFTRRALCTALRSGQWDPIGSPRRMGSIPGAGRLRLVPHLEALLRIPGFGHRFGTNWIVHARRVE